MATIEEKHAELKARGFTPIVDLPVVPVVIPGGLGTFFTFMTAAGPVTIYHEPSVGAHEVHGAILGTYLAQGGPTGWLGYPISDEYDSQVADAVTGKVSDFQGGSIFWDAASGQVSALPVASMGAGAFEAFVGIDVSYAQGSIDWSRVSTIGTSEGETIQFAYMKASEGDTVTDSMFMTNWNASRYKLARGAYHYFHPRKVDNDTRPQADNFIATITATGDVGELPPMVDVESLPSGVSAAEATASLQFFLSVVEEGVGKRPIIYTYPFFWKKEMANVGAFHHYHLWIANYGHKRADGGNDIRTTSPVIPGGWPTFAIWQNAIKPGVAGISTLVDRDVAIIPAGVDLADFLSQIP